MPGGSGGRSLAERIGQLEKEGLPSSAPVSPHSHPVGSHTHPYADSSHTHPADAHTHPYAETTHTHPYADASHAHPYAEVAHTHPAVAHTHPDTAVAASTVLAFRVLAQDTAGQVFHADAADLAHVFRVLGVSLTAANLGETLTLVKLGVFSGGGPWTPGPLFLGTAGQLVSGPPGVGFQLQIGAALSTTTVLVRPLFPIYL